MKLLEDRVKQLELENNHLRNEVKDLIRRLEAMESRFRGREPRFHTRGPVMPDLRGD